MDTGEGKSAQAPNINAPPTGQWTTGLFDCFDDTGICCSTWLCPQCIFGPNAEIIDQGRTSSRSATYIFCGLSLVGWAFLYSFKFRSKLRALYNLPEEPCGDLCVHYCCLVFAISQERRELKNRGLDTSVGWKGNEFAMRKANLVPPPVVPAMTR
ncbi:hypothetical protein GLYMA_09G187000v4 [Glycine max]|uniref:Protein FW2.2-like 1 n=1 Tax=Glycine max TaxID=3847 RepID=I1L4E6_SOYBN|nr:protein FW2.2-like 1 [Glycine max]KRH39230.1 hypothetical protein GLYMA_09G187000v4 [Glycine max]|eukprot:NP_001236296.2 FWL family protein FWL1 [Glycine max]